MKGGKKDRKKERKKERRKEGRKEVGEKRRIEGKKMKRGRKGTYALSMDAEARRGPKVLLLGRKEGRKEERN